MMERGVVETVLISDDADVSEVPEENQIAELILFARSGGAKTSPKRSGVAAFEVDPY